MASLVVLTPGDCQRLSWPECAICFDDLTSDSVQMHCCSQIYHRLCVYEWASSKRDREGGDSKMVCVHCCTTAVDYIWRDLVYGTQIAWEARREEARNHSYHLMAFNRLSINTAMGVMRYTLDR
jgi:hypothetical protein